MKPGDLVRFKNGYDKTYGTDDVGLLIKTAEGWSEGMWTMQVEVMFPSMMFTHPRGESLLEVVSEAR